MILYYDYMELFFKLVLKKGVIMKSANFRITIKQIIFLSTVLLSCAKEKNKTSSVYVRTLDPTPIEYSKTSIKYGGEVSTDNGIQIIERGVCWSLTDSIPTLSSNVKRNGEGSGYFIDTLKNLLPSTKYYVRAFAKTNNSTFYGEILTVNTNSTITGIRNLSLTVDKNDKQWSCDTYIYYGYGYSPNGPFNYLANSTEVGVCYSTSITTPTINDIRIPYQNITIPDQLGGTISSSLKSIIQPTINKTYYMRAYAFNTVDTVYSPYVITITTGGFEPGLYYGGGVIFSVNGQHGLIASLNDIGVTKWVPDNYSTVTINTNSTNGAINTTQIINRCGNVGDYAAKLCRDYRGGGFSDWYLPSSLETQFMLFEAESIGNLPINQPYGNDVFYWTSSENGNAWARVWVISRLLSGGWTFFGSGKEKWTQCRVRAIRAF